MNGKEEFDSMKNAVRLMNLLIVTEESGMSREDQVALFKGEFKSVDELFTALLDTFVNFVGTIALGTSVQENRPVADSEVLKAFRNGIAAIINESN